MREGGSLLAGEVSAVPVLMRVVLAPGSPVATAKRASIAWRVSNSVSVKRMLETLTGPPLLST
jgi:hypothetical protein